jgi:4-aminobutyrate aminotransferase/(S)-3-amino-2-methylpropionate transaminase
MGGGLPIAAVIGKADVMDAARPGTIGGTYGGNPVACASALATIRVMEEEDLNARSRQIGRMVKDRFTRLQQRCTLIGDVRGLGAMVGMEFVEDGDPSRPAGAVVRQIIDAAVARGLIVIPAGTYGNIIRVLCPLVITDDQLERGLDILEEEVLRYAGEPAAAGQGRG